MKMMGTLDRTVIRQWMATFLLSTLGIPAVAVLIRLSEIYGPLSDKGVSAHDILLGTLYLYPGQLALLFPAGVLFATVFTLNSMGRHNELTATKAGGISFHRLIAPMIVLAAIAVPVNYAIQEVAAVSGARQRILHKEKPDPHDMIRTNFAFQDTSGGIWSIKQLERARGHLGNTLIEFADDSAGAGQTLTADSATWNESLGRWTLYRGALHLPADSTTAMTTIAFATLTSSRLNQNPDGMLNTQSNATEMRTAELRRYLDRLRRLGVRPGQMAVDLPLKYAVPVACLVVALFGAPLAATKPRAGAAMGLAIALGTTLVYLTGTQIMKAMAGKGILPVDLAAWSMNVVFLVLAAVLLKRVRT